MKIMTTTKKITLATVKAFVRKAQNLHIRTKSQFDGMTDCVMPTDSNGFTIAVKSENHAEHTLGVAGAWFVLGGGDRCSAYEDDNFKGFSVYNCCGSFLLATPK
jgi:hypothetical protein